MWNSLENHGSQNQGLGLALSAKTYIQNVIPKFEGLFVKELKPIKKPMSEGYHPEIDDSPLCTKDDSAKYRSIIVLGRFNIAYATSAMSRFNMLPREGHLMISIHSLTDRSQRYGNALQYQSI
jgi:hypothetical protein